MAQARLMACAGMLVALRAESRSAYASRSRHSGYRTWTCISTTVSPSER